MCANVTLDVFRIEEDFGRAKARTNGKLYFSLAEQQLVSFFHSVLYILPPYTNGTFSNLID
uniref:Uncharacterized protein n=1 Tax=Rhizophora mucronata TaxID=61149 RepID=A0A2P2P803_RHIMU